MTQNQVSWQNMLEGQRHNLASEMIEIGKLSETQRANKAKETTYASEIYKNYAAGKASETSAAYTAAEIAAGKPQASVNLLLAQTKAQETQAGYNIAATKWQDYQVNYLGPAERENYLASAERNRYGSSTDYINGISNISRGIGLGTLVASTIKKSENNSSGGGGSTGDNAKFITKPVDAEDMEDWASEGYGMTREEAQLKVSNYLKNNIGFGPSFAEKAVVGIGSSIFGLSSLGTSGVLSPINLIQ